MKPASFAFFRPGTLAELLPLLAQHGEFGKIIAGGQSLVPSMNFRLARPTTLIDINGIQELEGVHDAGDCLEIGAITRHAAFHDTVCEGPTGRLLGKAVRHIAHYPIRQRGTFGGSLAHADPAAEWCLVTATLNGVIDIEGPAGKREVTAADFFQGTFTTALRPDELLVRVRLPKLTAGWGTGFNEFSRRQGDFALAMAAAALRIESGSIAAVRIGLGAVASKPLRLSVLEERLVGSRADRETLSAIAAEVPGMVNPTSDIHGSAEYRRDLAAAVVRRALFEALDEAVR